MLWTVNYKGFLCPWEFKYQILQHSFQNYDLRKSNVKIGQEIRKGFVDKTHFMNYILGL